MLIHVGCNCYFKSFTKKKKKCYLKSESTSSILQPCTSHLSLSQLKKSDLHIYNLDVLMDYLGTSNPELVRPRREKNNLSGDAPAAASSPHSAS